jgi:hypothetical protein
MAEIEYQRLARSRFRRRFAVAVSSRTSLWLGPDHLLFIESNGYTENYKRFYFRDIQALTIQQTITVRAVNTVLGIVTGLFAFFGVVIARDSAARIPLLVIAGVFGLILLLHAIPGTSCKCWIRTAVQTEELAALARVRQARKVLDRLRPLIAAAQGGTSPRENIPGASPAAEAPAGAPMAVDKIAVDKGPEPANVPPQLGS